MALINRISRLFKADFHAVLDQIEEPEAVLKQAIRDMEDDLASAEQRSNLCEHDQETLTQRTQELASAIAEFDAQLDLCFASEKDELARSTIRKKLEAERLLKRMNAKHSANAKHLDEQKASLDANTSTLESLRQKAELFAQRTPTHSPSDSDCNDLAWMSRELTIADDEVEIAYLSERNARSAS